MKIFPKSIKKGDKIAIISPAGSVEPTQLEKGIEMIKSKGFEPILGEHLYTKFSNGYNYAGTEDQRLKDINWALNDNEISAVWASRGGYGCQHLLHGLNLKEFSKNPKWYIGYSDNTVIQSFLMKKGFASIHAQTIKTSSFGVTEESYDLIFDILKGKSPKYSLESSQFNKKGNIEGELIGGNLALIYALLGTKYSFDFKDKILFIEDIGENFYALDRMMMSLELAGVFTKIKGLIVGGMTNMGDEKDNKQYEESFDEFANKLISDRISKYNFPVVFDFPNGHIKDNRPLIIGSKVSLKIGEKTSLNFKK
ncbi:S66 peptidase family protein [Chryseobacterium indoltheticum]|uniref:Muramoyltetrapeptide carboxypeptidase n=1 Tax=Chryseobacterium indoltheticum TaxID=254 RepID=A0A381F692_9FLAO|nr:LD-carboxypeptidase [Chryseobacterium indoltheticum]AZA72501.1 LD-carboxypeptidase [Chryseobacterium indoltheticum]SIQ83681.1 muramoyltetrapeptide carboxypeptidase [Chryseobacterium indoltheticum]SUX42076.1 Murein tetrapeptide carboxypeptidase [Chryseobacterium indoltheticum]